MSGLTRRSAWAALAAVAALLSGCESGPKGPGPLSASIEGPVPLGAAIVEVRGDGVTGFEGVGSTHVFSAPGQGGVFRVVLVGEVAGDLGFKVNVQERRDTPPTATVLSAAGGDNVPLSTMEAFQVRVVR